MTGVLCCITGRDQSFQSNEKTIEYSNQWIATGMALLSCKKSVERINGPFLIYEQPKQVRVEAWVIYYIYISVVHISRKHQINIICDCSLLDPDGTLMYKYTFVLEIILLIFSTLY